MAATMARSLSRCGALNDIYLLVPKRDKNSFKLLVIALDYPALKHVRIKCLCASFCWLGIYWLNTKFTVERGLNCQERQSEYTRQAQNVHRRICLLHSYSCSTTNWVKWNILMCVQHTFFACLLYLCDKRAVCSVKNLVMNLKEIGFPFGFAAKDKLIS